MGSVKPGGGMGVGGGGGFKRGTCFILWPIKVGTFLGEATY